MAREFRPSFFIHIPVELAEFVENLAARKSYEFAVHAHVKRKKGRHIYLSNKWEYPLPQANGYRKVSLPENACRGWDVHIHVHPRGFKRLSAADRHLVWTGLYKYVILYTRGVGWTEAMSAEGIGRPITYT